MYRTLFIAFMVAIGCFSSPYAISATKPYLPPSGVQGSWIIVSQVDAKGNMDDLKMGSILNIDLKTNAITANLGCNNMTGSWVEKKENKLKKVVLMGTKMACDADLMTLETLFSKNMAKVTSYKFNGTMLEFYSRRKLIMVLKRG